MFQGTMIEELIGSVVRAEEHARQQERASALERPGGFLRAEWRQEMIEVA